MSNGINLNRTIRVGFFLNFSDMWAGGVNYYNSLFSLLAKHGSGKILPVIFTHDANTAEKLKNLHGESVEIVIIPAIKRWSFEWFVKRIILRPLGIYWSNKILIKQNIDVVSHSYLNLPASPIKTLSWIPDFQHIHLKEMFSYFEIKNRDKFFKNCITHNDGVILSSYDAKKDLELFKKEHHIDSKVEVHVLHFAANYDGKIIDRDKLLSKFKIKSEYLYLPNQFWAHKNHKTVIEALNVLKQKGENITIVSTGKTDDYRNKEHFKSIQELIRSYGLEENFMILGQVSYEEVISLMSHAKAVINPSLFEGWSTTVEEAKMLGKCLILSDIAVHREQNPTGAIFFSPCDCNSLADIISKINNEPERKFHGNYEECQKEVVATYEKIISELMPNVHF